MRTKSGIHLPAFPQPRPRSFGRPKPYRPRTYGLAALIEPDGTIAWQDDEWMPNLWHDAGEQNVGQVYFQEAAHAAKFLGLLNDASVAETDGTMSAVTESKTPGVDGYSRPQYINTDWSGDGLQAGDHRFSGAEKTIGPISGTALVATHSSLSTTATGAGALLSTIILSATTTVAPLQSLKYIRRTSIS